MVESTIGIDAMKERVALYISCRKLKDMDLTSKTDPQVDVFVKDRTSKDWYLCGKTEVINNNLNPDFSKFIECDYYFEREQHVRFMLWDVDSTAKREFIGKCETTIGKIIGAPRQTFLSDLTLENDKKSRGKIIVRLDSVSKNNDEVRMKLSARLTPKATLCCDGINNPYFVISRARDHTNTSEFVRVYQSDHVRNNPNPSYVPMKIKLA